MVVRTYVEDHIHKRVRKFAADQGLGLQDSYTRLINMALDEEGKERGEIPFLTEEQMECVKILAKEMGGGFNEACRDLMDIAILYMFVDLSFRQVVAGALPVMLDQLAEEYPEIAKRIIMRYARYTK